MLKQVTRYLFFGKMMIFIKITAHLGVKFSSFSKKLQQAYLYWKDAQHIQKRTVLLLKWDSGARKGAKISLNRNYFISLFFQSGNFEKLSPPTFFIRLRWNFQDTLRRPIRPYVRIRIFKFFTRAASASSNVMSLPNLVHSKMLKPPWWKIWKSGCVHKVV